MKHLLNVLIMALFSNLVIAQGSSEDHDPAVKSEFIFLAEDVSFPSCHASTIDETEHGLVAAWFAGTSDKDPDVGIWVSRCINEKWTRPVEVVNGIQNKRKRYPTWGSRSKLNMAVSGDGINWSAAADLENDPDPDSEYSYPAVIQTRDGMIHQGLKPEPL